MSRFFLPRLLPVAAGLLLLGGPLAAGPADTPPAAPAETPPAAPAVDPQVQTLLDQTVAAQQALTNFSATLTVENTGGPGKATPLQTILLSVDKSLGANAAVSDTTGPLARIVSDTKSVTIYDVHAKKYQSETLPAGSPAAAVVLASTRSLLAQIMARPEELNQIAAQKGVAAALGTPTTLSGVAADTMTFTPPASPSGQSVITFAVGHDDHLVRQVSITITPTGADAAKPVTHTETVTTLSTTPALTAADFAFTPPAGVTKAVAQAQPPMHDPRLVPGARPFALKATDLAGKPISLAQYKGKVVLMDFWATWCGPCVGEMPNVIANYKKYHAQGFDIVGVSLDQDKGALTKYIAANKMPWRQIFDGKGWGSAVGKQYGVQAIPFGLLIGRDGKIIALEVRGPALGPAIAKALAAKAPPAAKPAKTASK